MIAQATAKAIMAIVEAEIDPARYAEMIRVESHSIPLAELITIGYATATADGVEILKESLAELSHYVERGVWCGGRWGCPNGCGQPRTVDGVAAL